MAQRKIRRLHTQMCSRTPHADLPRRPSTGHDRIVGLWKNIDREGERWRETIQLHVYIIRHI